METKEIVQEGANINKSLLALTNCINILSSNKNSKSSSTAPYIPYRNSKLTRLLKDSLGGRTPVVMIVCLSPNSIYLEESINSIKYAQKARNIKMTYKKDQINSTGYLGMLSHFGNTETFRDNIISERNWVMREAYEKRIQELEKECRYWRTLRERNMTERSQGFTERNKIVVNVEDSLEIALNGLPLDNIEEEFCELVQALVENVEDENLLKQNVLELDELIRQNDHDINEVQKHIEECKSGEIVTELYEELKFLADRLEENLDLKEEAIKEADMLKRTIECTKLALKKMFIQRIKQAKNYSKNNSGYPEMRSRIQELSNRNAELSNALGSLIGEESVEDFLKESKTGSSNREVFKEIENKENFHLNMKKKTLKNAGVGEVLNILMYKFKPKSKDKSLISPLEFTKDIKSEGKTLIYSDSAREDFKTMTGRNKKLTSKRSGIKGEDIRRGYGNYIQSGRGTEDTNTNPMSLISSSSGRYISNDESKNSLI